MQCTMLVLLMLLISSIDASVASEVGRRSLSSGKCLVDNPSNAGKPLCYMNGVHVDTCSNKGCGGCCGSQCSWVGTYCNEADGVVAMCPDGYSQVGTLSENNDIGGVGLGQSQQDSIGKCKTLCENDTNCVAFMYGGSSTEGDSALCELSGSVTPNNNWGSNFRFCRKTVKCLQENPNNANKPLCFLNEVHHDTCSNKGCGGCCGSTCSWISNYCSESIVAECPSGYKQIGTLSENNDVAGFGLGQTQEDSIEDCQALCESTEGCAAFMYGGASTVHDSKICELSSIGAPNNSWGSNLRFCQKQLDYQLISENKRCNEQPGEENMLAQIDSTEDPAECAVQCAMNEDCQYFTWFESDGHCNLCDVYSGTNSGGDSYELILDDTRSQSCVENVSTGNTRRYDNMLDLTLDSSKSVTFSVKASNDAHIGFFSDAQSTREVYEIVIGGWGNTKSVIRESNQGRNRVQASTRNILNRNQFVDFWADAKNGLVRLGRGHTVGQNIVMQWQDPNPHTATKVGLMTGWGATGLWNVCAPNAEQNLCDDNCGAPCNMPCHGGFCVTVMGVCQPNGSCTMNTDPNCCPVIQVGNGVIYRAKKDTGRRMQFVTEYEIEESGKLDLWEFYTFRPDEMVLQVFRPMGSHLQYSLVGSTTVNAIPGYNQIQANIDVEAGDVLGWYCSGRQPIRFQNGGRTVRRRYGYTGLESEVSVSNHANGWARTYSIRARIQACRDKLRIVHMNDHHSHVNAFEGTWDMLSVPMPAVVNLEEAKIKYGGLARATTLVKELRAEHSDSITLHAGDAITGTNWFTIFEGETDALMMNAICFDAFAVGNHEFDYHDEGLAKFIDYLEDDSDSCTPNTAVLGANVVPHANSPLVGKLKNSTVITTASGLEIGIVGINTQYKTMMGSFPDEGTIVTDEKAAAQAEIDQLLAQGINKIVLLSHVGYDNDLILASQLSGVDVIVGGDSHSMLGEDNANDLHMVAGPYPDELTNADGDKVCVVTAWEYSKMVGHIDVEFDKNGKVQACQGNSYIVFDGIFYEDADTTIEQAYGASVANSVEQEASLNYPILRSASEDSTVLSIIDTYYEQIEEQEQAIIATFNETMCLEEAPGQGKSAACPVISSFERGGDSCNLVSKAYLLHSLNFGTDVAINNGGGCRDDIPAGNYSIADAFEMLPYPNTLIIFNMTGQQIKDVLEDALHETVTQGSEGSYPYAAGLLFDVDASKPKDQRVSNLKVNEKLQNSWTVIDMTKTYKVITNSFIAAGKDGYTTYTQLDPYETGLLYTQTFIDWLKSHNDAIQALPSDQFSTHSFTNTLGCLHTEEDFDDFYNGGSCDPNNVRRMLTDHVPLVGRLMPPMKARS